MRKLFFSILPALIILTISNCAFAERDWEYWSRYSLETPINKEISYLIKPEWKIKNDMRDNYLFKLEQAIAFKLNKFLEVAPYYVWQEKKSSGNYDRSDLAYLDITGKMPFKKFFELKVLDRLRYQYNFDTNITTWRNSTRLTKAFKLAKFEIFPFVEDEIFYDTKLDTFNENWASAGLSLSLNKYANIGISYLLDTKKKGDDWSYTNVLVTSLSLKF